jgi:nucleoside-diphosphate-sugar epimerase
MRQVEKGNEVLVVGAGFIGRRIAQYLWGQNIAVTLASRSSSSKEPNCLHLDLSDPKSISKVLCDVKPCCIVLTAFDFLADRCRNLAMIDNFISSLSHTGTDARVIYLSSSAEYGTLSCPSDAFTEQSPLNPVNEYGEIKAQISANLKSGVNQCNVLRLFNPYSDELPEKYFVGRLWASIFAARASDRNKTQFSLKCHSDVRDFFDFDLLYRITENIIVRDDDVGILNVSTGIGTRVLDLAQGLIDLYCPGKIELNIDYQHPNSSLPYSIGDTGKLASLGFVSKKLEL